MTLRWPTGNNEMAELIRSFDWSSTTLGPWESWPEQLRTMVDHMLASPLVSSIAVGAGRSILYNDAAALLYGSNHPQALGRPLAAVFPNSYPQVAASYDRVFAGECVIVLAQPLALHDRHNGDVPIFDAYLTPVRDGGGRIIAAHMVGFEIGDRVRAQSALTEKDRRYRALYESIDEGFCIIEMLFDEANRPVDYRFVEANPAFVAQTGLHDAIGRTIREMAPDLEQEWFDIYGRIALSGEAERFEHRAETLGRWYDVFAFRIGEPEQRQVAVLFRDVLQRKQQELRLRENQERQTFLLGLTDTLRPIADAAEIESVTSRMVADYLETDRAMFAEVEGDCGAETGTIHGQYVRGKNVDAPKVAPFPVSFAYADYGEHRMAARYAGELLVVPDIEADPAADAEERSAWAAANVRAAVVAPLVKAGRLVAEFGVHCATPRNWTASELALMREVAERTWDAVQRARAEKELRDREAELARTQRIGQVASVEVAFDGKLTGHRSPEYRRLHGLPDELVFENHQQWLDRVHPDDRARADRAFLTAMANGEHYKSEYRIIRPSDGAMRWISATGEIERNANGQPLRMVGAHSDVTERKRNEAALRESEARLGTLIDGIPQLVWRARDPGEWTWASRQWIDYTGQTETESFGHGWLAALHPDDRNRALLAWSAATEDAVLEVEYRICQAATGQYCWFQTRAKPVYDSDGSIVEWLGTSTDIDDLRSMQERQQLLLAELQHRVRNILTVVRSVFERTMEAAHDPEDAALHFLGRLGALARTQIIVTASNDVSADLENLIRDELVSVGALDDAKVHLHGPDIKLNAGLAEMLGLAVHELTVNALKYGALKATGATLTVTWDTNIDQYGAPWLHLLWEERGVPVLPVGATKQGFGRELIEEALPYRVGAVTTLTLQGGGLICRIAVPMTDN